MKKSSMSALFSVIVIFLFLNSTAFALTVNTSDIADGAVTDAKISGPISASKISSAGLNADTVDGMHAADLAPAIHTHTQSQVTDLESTLAGKSDVTHDHDVRYQQKYGKMAVVAKTGGDYTDLPAAMTDLANWCGSPSESNPCLVKIMPGVYDMGGNFFQMQSYVDIEGSGEIATVISGNGASGVVSTVANAELRSLTVKHTGGSMPQSKAIVGVDPILTNVTAIALNFQNMFSKAILTEGTGIIRNVTAIATGGSDCSAFGLISGNIKISNAIANVSCTSEGKGIHNFGATLEVDNTTLNVSCPTCSSIGISNTNSNATLRNVTINATGSVANVGIKSLMSTMTLTNTTIDVSGGMYTNYGITGPNNVGTIRIDRSSIKASTNSIYSYAGGILYIGGTKLDGGPVIGSVTCAGVYDENYAFYPSTCP